MTTGNRAQLGHGQRGEPADWGTCPRAENMSPNASPAIRPFATSSFIRGSATPSPDGSVDVETSQMAAKAQAMPSRVSGWGRSPVMIPTVTGTSAAPTAERGGADDAHPAAGQTAVQEPRADPGPDTGEGAPREVGAGRAAWLEHGDGAEGDDCRDLGHEATPQTEALRLTTPPAKSDSP